jgi:hypothetical protein
VETKVFFFIFYTFILAYFSIIFLLVSFKERFYSPDIYSFRFVSACNPDSSICMNYCDCPWFWLFRTLCFAEYTIFQDQYFTTNCVIIINAFTIFMDCILISLALPVVSYFFSVSYEGYIEQNIPSKYCCFWRGVKYCMIGRVDGP